MPTQTTKDEHHIQAREHENDRPQINSKNKA